MHQRTALGVRHSKSFRGNHQTRIIHLQQIPSGFFIILLFTSSSTSRASTGLRSANRDSPFNFAPRADNSSSSPEMAQYQPTWQSPGWELHNPANQKPDRVRANLP